MEGRLVVLRRHAVALVMLPLVLVSAAPVSRAAASPAIEAPQSCPDSVTGEGEKSSGIMDAAIAWWRSLAAKFDKPTVRNPDDAIVCEVLEGGKTRCVSVAERCRTVDPALKVPM